MKAYIENWSIEVIIMVASFLGGALSWIISKLANYKKKVKDDTLNEVTVDRIQDGKILALNSKLLILESVVDRIKNDIHGIKQDNRVMEQRIDNKLDMIYNKLLEGNG